MHTPSVSNLLNIFACSSSSVATNIKVIDVDHLSNHCLITADVVGRVPNPIITYTSGKICAIDAEMFDNELRQSSFTQPANTVDAYVHQLQVWHIRWKAPNLRDS